MWESRIESRTVYHPRVLSTSGTSVKYGGLLIIIRDKIYDPDVVIRCVCVVFKDWDS